MHMSSIWEAINECYRDIVKLHSDGVPLRLVYRHVLRERSNQLARTIKEYAAPEEFAREMVKAGLPVDPQSVVRFAVNAYINLLPEAPTLGYERILRSTVERALVQYRHLEQKMPLDS